MFKTAPDKSVALIGLGLLGASLGLALKKSGVKRLGWARRAETRQWCLEHDAVDQTFDTIDEAVADADITILCVPIPAIIEILTCHAAAFKKGSVVTDIGSDKSVIVAAGEKALMLLSDMRDGADFSIRPADWIK